MVRLREIPRTSTFAWSPPGAHLPIIATGTVAGAVDADFSNTTQLELWDLDLQNGQTGLELSPKASVNTESRYAESPCASIKAYVNSGIDFTTLLGAG